MTDLLKTLICASEKAASIARSCKASCAEELLVAEKCGGEANSRFNKDFKTIADVLAQESAKGLILKHHPDIKDLRGEECAEIGGISINIKDTSDETAAILRLLVPAGSASKMSEAAHCNVDTKFCENLPDLPNVDPSNVGIWIDPIDGTAEFIAGVQGGEGAYNRLLCVTVLIGAYLKTTGEPIIGVINQPFYNNGEGRVIWGAKIDDTLECSEQNTNKHSDSKTILMSSSEEPEIIQKFINSGWEVKFEAGAGNKLMKVALGEAKAYLVTKGTTFRWDTCAPHAILKAKGGDVLNKTYKPIKYNDEKNLDTQEYCNKDGITAFTNQNVFEDIKKILS
ncbi:inositol polyphosphate 1-phosphatase [Aricia agestis]|uniref:inositol polyphosphate 1-phosphatase n=1 Tax=Aricia agestis TaxID=91739 RepID=UPI001C20C373|nr:inositol polyphosphate 1-phosphatase [Aricia agestis]